MTDHEAEISVASANDDPQTAVGASHLLGMDWPDAHPLILVKQSTRQWNRPVSPTEGRDIAGAALMAFLRDKGDSLGLPVSLARYGLSYIKAGAYSQIRRLLLDGEATPWMVELPADLDARADVIAQNHTNFAHFHAIGRSRFVPEPLYLYRGERPGEGSSKQFAVSIHGFFDGFEELNFGKGTLRRWNVADRDDPMIPLPEDEVANVLAEMIAVMVYHFELDAATPGRGTAITGIQVNRGDFIYRANEDGSPDVKLITIRGRRQGISIPAFVLALIQMAAAEEMIPDRDKVGSQLGFRVELPVLISNPAVAFHGIARGLQYLFAELDDPNEAEEETRCWLTMFGESDLGAPYRPWIGRYLAGNLPLSFGNDVREGIPDLGTVMGVQAQLVQAQSEGNDYGDPHAFDLTLNYLKAWTPRSSTVNAPACGAPC